MIDTRGHEGGKDWIDFSFKNQDTFYSAATQNMTTNQIQYLIAATAGNSSLLFKYNYTQTDYLNALSNSTYNSEARVGWKICIMAGVSGTPTFNGNQVGIVGSGSWNEK
jgi:hypothetical protein